MSSTTKKTINNDNNNNNNNLQTDHTNSNKDELLKTRKLRAKTDIKTKNPYKSLSPSHMRPTYSSMRRDSRIKGRISENPFKTSKNRDKVTAGVKRVANGEAKGLSNKLNSPNNLTSTTHNKLKLTTKGSIEIKKEQQVITKSKVISTKFRAKEKKSLSPIIQEPEKELELNKLITKEDTLKDKESPLILESGLRTPENINDDFAAPLPINRSISPNLQLKFSVRGIKLIGPLGTGATSSVWLVSQRRSKFKYAIKYIKKSVVSEKGIGEQIMREFNNQYPLHHPNIIQSYYYFLDNTGIFIGQEFASYGQLLDLIRKSNHLSELRGAKYTAQLADILWYLKLKRIIHRDLKPENLLIDKHYNLKLTDFGSSICLQNNSERRRTHTGTIDYISPELLQESHTHSISTDYWSLGCVIFEMLTGKPPFEGYCKQITIERIKNLDFKFPPHVTDLAKDLIKKLIVLEPEDRLEPEEVLNHPWIKKYCPGYNCFTEKLVKD